MFTYYFIIFILIMNNIKYFFNSDIGVVYYKIFMSEFNNENIKNYVMYSDNFNNKNDKMKKNDIHFQFTNFIINTALYHRKIDKSLESNDEVKNLRNNLEIKIKKIFNNKTKKYDIDVLLKDLNLEYINEMIMLCLINLIKNIKENKIDINYLNIVNNDKIVNSIIKNKKLEKINIFISNCSIKIFNIFDLFLKQNNLNINLNLKKKKQLIKNINNLFFNFIKKELHLIIKKLKETNYFTTEHYILRIKTLINEFINTDFNDNLNLIIDSIFFEFKSNIYTDDYYDYKKSYFTKNFFKNIYDNINNLTFEERFFYNSYVNLCNKTSNKSDTRINLKKISYGSKYNLFYNSIPKLNDNDIWYTNYENNIEKIENNDENILKKIYELIYFNNSNDSILEIIINNNNLKISNNIEFKKNLDLNLNKIIKKNLLIINNTDFLNKIKINEEEEMIQTCLFNLLFDEDIDSLINYNINENEFKLDNIHPVIAFRLLNNLGFRLFSDSNKTIIENLESWNKNIINKNQIQELIILNSNINKYIKYVINYVNKHNTIFKNKFIKKNIIIVRDASEYISKIKNDEIINTDELNDKNMLIILKNNIITNINSLNYKINTNIELSIDSSSLGNINGIKSSLDNVFNCEYNNEYNYKYFKDLINKKFKIMIINNIFIDKNLKKIIIKNLKEIKFFEKELLKINNLTNEYIILTDVFDIYNNKLLNNENITNLINKNEKILMKYYHKQILIINIILDLEELIKKNTLRDL
jgi:hypothetical protein